VNESLALLRFREVVDRFGMFFLHDLDLNRRVCLPPVLAMDDLGVLKSLGVNLSKRRANIKFPDPDESTEIYPLGEAPSWPDVERCIRDQPYLLMRPWSWSDDLGLLEQTACHLFLSFTTQIWTCLNARWRKNQTRISPKTVKEAIECWTVNKVFSEIIDVSCMPCNANLPGSITGRRMPSFSDRQTLYFPPTSKDLTGYWHLLSQRPGYIKEYQDICSGLSKDDISELNSDLSTLLSQCQCLPLSTQTKKNESKTQQVIWKVQNKKVLVMTNPSFYKLVRIGATSRHSKTRAPPAHTPKKALQISLLEQSGISQVVARKAVNLSRTLQKEDYDKTRRSGKTKNQRVPPQRKKAPVQQELQSEDSDSDDDEEDEDDEDEDDEEEDEIDEDSDKSDF
jgi:hypothetical protein